MYFCLENVGTHIPGTDFLGGLQSVRVPWRGCSPCQAPAPPQEGSGGQFPRLGRDGCGPTTIPGCGCARKHEKQHHVPVLLVEHRYHVENLRRAPCHEPPGPSGWGGRSCHPSNTELRQKPPGKARGGFCRPDPGEEMPLTGDAVFSRETIPSGGGRAKPLPRRMNLAQSPWKRWPGPGAARVCTSPVDLT